MEKTAFTTYYKGFKFRSRLEARYAVFFDFLDIIWKYELESFKLNNDLLYLPDFFLPTLGECGVWFEIKGLYPDENEQNKAALLAKQTGSHVIITHDLPLENDIFFYNKENTTPCKCSLYDALPSLLSISQSDLKLFHSSVTRATNYAKQARFEHDEKPFDSAPTSGQEILSNVLDDIDKIFQSSPPLMGIPSSFEELDLIINGISSGLLTYISGVPNSGYLEFCVNIVTNILIGEEKKPVLIFSPSLDSKIILSYMLSSVSRLSRDQIFHGQLQYDEWPLLTMGINILAEVDLLVDDTPNLTLSDIFNKSQDWIASRSHLNPVILILEADFIISEQPYNISKELKRLARILKTPVIVSSPCNTKKIESRNNYQKRPMISDLQFTGIDVYSDFILFLYRDELYNEESLDKGRAELIIAKNHYGRLGTVTLAYRPQFSRFENFIYCEEDIPKYS